MTILVFSNLIFCALNTMKKIEFLLSSLSKKSCKILRNQTSYTTKYILKQEVKQNGIDCGMNGKLIVIKN